jgi:hypothetical protein
VTAKTGAMGRERNKAQVERGVTKNSRQKWKWDRGLCKQYQSIAHI